jgi:hypothetical protein
MKNDPTFGRFLFFSLVTVVALVVILQAGLAIRRDGRNVRELQTRVYRLQARVTTLERACGPVNTGGGVTQCANPNVLQAPPN